MKRNIVHIHEDKCIGCGLCVNACHEGALELIDGKAVLVSDSYCDGLGNCLPKCPVDAIEIIQREADEFDKKSVEKRKKEKNIQEPLAGGCPGRNVKEIKREKSTSVKTATANTENVELVSELRQWPIQIKLVPPNAPYFDNAHILVAADCTAFAYANFHQDFMKGKITLIGCPKLDGTDYAEKLTAILKHNNVKKITVLRMSVPCCSGIVSGVKTAIIDSGKLIPWDYQIITTEGDLVEDN